MDAFNFTNDNDSRCFYNPEAGNGEDEFPVYPAISPGVVISIKVVTCVCSVTSMAAACWIILTYLLFRDLRTTARQLLVNLSLADIVVAGSHLLGTLLNYDRFIPHYDSRYINASQYDPLCVSQAAFTMYGSIASFVWTVSIAVYMLLLTACGRRRRLLGAAVVLSYLLGWGLPVPFMVASAVQRHLGYQYMGATGEDCLVF